MQALGLDIALAEDDFAAMVALVKTRTGIILSDQKRNMVFARLAPRLRKLQMNDFRAYLQLIRSPAGKDELEAAMNAITTNLTRFFREKHHFDHLAAEVLSEALWNGGVDGSKRLRLWSAGCSTGEEAWSMAMTIKDAIHDVDTAWDVRVLATDINTEVIEKVNRGVYDDKDVEPIAEPTRRKYFSAVDGGQFRVVDSLRPLVQFKPLNLLGPWPMKGPFDVIFFRNVQIYFDRPTQLELADRFADMLRPGGFLYIGHSETLINVNNRFAPKGRSTYKKRA